MQQGFCKIRATEYRLKDIGNSNRLLYLGRINEKSYGQASDRNSKSRTSQSPERCKQPMRPLLTIITFLIVTSAFSQDWTLYDIYQKVSPTDKDAMQSYQNILSKYDSTEKINSSVCSQVCEKLAEIYKSRHEYLKAIAYYDSIELKYRDMTLWCGNHIYALRADNRLNIALCYVEMQDTLKALGELAPFIFHYENDYYCDGKISDFYIKTLKLTYTKDRIRNIIDSSLNGLTYNYETYQSSTNDSEPTLSVQGLIWLFNVQFEIAHYTTTPSWDKTVTDSVKKDYFIRRLKETKIFKEIYD